MNPKTITEGKDCDVSPSGSDDTCLARLEQLIAQDTGRRGLATVSGENLLTHCKGNLAAAASHLAAEASSVGIITGFYKPGEQGPTIETDGPCGAIALAWLLSQLGMEVTIISDAIATPVIAAGLAASPAGGRGTELVSFPFENDDPSTRERNSNETADSTRSLEFTEQFFRFGPGGQLTHLIAIERPGPSHSAASLQRDTAEQQQRFGQLCPPEHQNHPHDFRGRIITPFTAKIHMLLDFIAGNCLAVHTVGIGDGGNEIGMGSIPWHVVQANVAGGLGARIACRVRTDWTITAGVSNWGAYALGAAVAYLRGHAELVNDWSDACEEAVLSGLVEGGAVDGVSCRREMTVDGIPLEQHLAIWGEIRRAVNRNTMINDQ